MSFVSGTIILIAVYFVCGSAASLVEQRLRLISIAHGAMFGTGAYIFAIISTRYGWGHGAVFSAVIISGVVGVGLVLLSDRLMGEDYTLASFAFQIIWFGLMSNAQTLTGGALGIPNISGLVNMRFVDPLMKYLIICIILSAAVFVLMRRISGSYFAVASSIISCSRELAVTLGIPSSTAKVQIGILYGGISGLAGVLLASYIGYIDPTLFATEVSITILATGFFASLGGSLWVLFGAALLVGLPEVMRFVGMSTTQAAYLQMVLSGSAVTLAAIAFLRQRYPRSVL